VTDLIVVEKIAQWKRLKMLALDSVASADANKSRGSIMGTHHRKSPALVSPGGVQSCKTAAGVHLASKSSIAKSFVLRKNVCR
jgi:hypothetical protein